MTEINTNNLNAHYSRQVKIECPTHVTADAPLAIPQYHAFNDIDANEKFKRINNDIYVAEEREKVRPAQRFTKFFLGIIAVIVAVLGIKKFLK